ncbi:hypothetical protein [Pseudoclavibacter sp. 8L]|uniref:hypothetical protein n=1 Tax=Pseudoclavibacter sp. 8L TaxID=2653162 RepID=UPI0012F04106|nr:hypothetical protein [Pseudoclavibacter sp. 8L]VXB76038.1 hypothetical protein PSCLAVI8L_180167 [Pseudoclavibacter sp. 8L]
MKDTRTLFDADGCTVDMNREDDDKVRMFANGCALDAHTVGEVLAKANELGVAMPVRVIPAAEFEIARGHFKAVYAQFDKTPSPTMSKLALTAALASLGIEVARG